MFLTRTIRRFAQQAITWSAMLMLLVQPLGLQAADCGCCSAENALVDAKISCAPISGGSCCGNVPESCCSPKSTNCCSSKKSACCSSTKSSDDTPCNCGENCQCGVSEDSTPFTPAIPTNDSTSQQTQILALAIQTISGIDAAPLGDEFPQAESASPVSLTAQQACALLSRFTC